MYRQECFWTSCQTDRSAVLAFKNNHIVNLNGYRWNYGGAWVSTLAGCHVTFVYNTAAAAAY